MERVWIVYEWKGSDPGGPLKYTSVHMREQQKNVWKGYFFTGRCVCDALRMSKTVFWEEKVTSEIYLWCEKGTIFSQFIPWYLSAREAKVDYDFQYKNWVGCVNFLTKPCKGFFFNKNLFRVTLSSMWTRLRGDFHQGVKTNLGVFWRNFGHECVHCYI